MHLLDRKQLDEIEREEDMGIFVRNQVYQETIEQIKNGMPDYQLWNKLALALDYHKKDWIPMLIAIACNAYKEGKDPLAQTALNELTNAYVENQDDIDKQLQK